MRPEIRLALGMLQVKRFEQIKIFTIPDEVRESCFSQAEKGFYHHDCPIGCIPEPSAVS
jgi:hypothetical protein